MIRLHRPGLILAGIAVTLLNVAVTVPAIASSACGLCRRRAIPARYRLTPSILSSARWSSAGCPAGRSP